MDDLKEKLRQLVAEGCQHPPGSLKRQRCLTQIIRLTTPKLWKESTPYYPDALQQTWMYFCKNICTNYDPDRASIVTWLNNHLRYRLQDFYQAASREAKTQTPLDSQAGEDAIGIITDLASPKPDLPPILERVKEWVELDATGELRRLHIEKHPEVTCQVLILRRLPPETSWKELAREFNVPVPTLSSFFQRQCLPRLRKFGESEGYL
jgi:DNA-directed RNA polymerase specialized sigma24 family protein